MTKSEKSTLTRILSEIDALFLPYRGTGDAACIPRAALMSRQTAFPRYGVQFTVDGDGGQRLAGERELQKLAGYGLVSLQFDGKRSGVALTPWGDDVARSLTAGYSARESFPLIKLIEQTKAKIGGANSGFTLEYDLLDIDFESLKSRDLAMLENKMLPLLCRGWVMSAGDTQGRIGYRVSPEGLATRRPRATEVPGYDRFCGDLYDRLFNEALFERESFRSRSIGIPLSAGMWPSGRLMAERPEGDSRV